MFKTGYIKPRMWFSHATGHWYCSWKGIVSCKLEARHAYTDCIYHVLNMKKRKLSV